MHLFVLKYGPPPKHGSPASVQNILKEAVLHLTPLTKIVTCEAQRIPWNDSIAFQCPLGHSIIFLLYLIPRRNSGHFR